MQLIANNIHSDLFFLFTLLAAPLFLTCFCLFSLRLLQSIAFYAIRFFFFCIQLCVHIYNVCLLVHIFFFFFLVFRFFFCFRMRRLFQVHHKCCKMTTSALEKQIRNSELCCCCCLGRFIDGNCVMEALSCWLAVRV